MWVAFADIGQARDPGVVGLLQHVVEGQQFQRATDHFVLRYIERLPLGTPYGKLLKQLDRLLNIPEARGDIEGVIDGGGIGRAIMEMARDRGMDIHAITATAGHEQGFNDIGITVPKIDLVQGFIISLENDRFHVPESLPAGASEDQIREYAAVRRQLSKEMADLKIKVDTRTKHVGIEAGHEEIHDDMVMAICNGLYWIKRRTNLIEDREPEETAAKPYNEMTYGMTN